MKISNPLSYARISSTVENLKQTAKTQYNKISESKPGKITLSLLSSIKKIVNIPIELVKKHPNATIAAGIFTTLVGTITANPPTMAIGMTLLISGGLAKYSNLTAEIRANYPVAQIPQEIASE